MINFVNKNQNIENYFISEIKELIGIMYQKPNYKSGPNPALCKYNTIKVIDIEGFIGYNGFQSFRRIIESKGFAGIDTSKNELYVGK